MGSADDDERADSDEMPAHEVTLSEFWIARTEITNEQYRRFRQKDVHGKPDDFPAVNATWHDAKSFCERFGFRLPTEAEWEYAARAGTQTAWSFGDDDSDVGRHAWYMGNSGDAAHPVATRKPNPWGLHDMHGGVTEWVADWYGEYSRQPETNPRGPENGSDRVLRGGAFINDPKALRSAFRGRNQPEHKYRLVGFRCVHNPRVEP